MSGQVSIGVCIATLVLEGGFVFHFHFIPILRLRQLGCALGPSRTDDGPKGLERSLTGPKRKRHDDCIWV